MHLLFNIPIKRDGVIGKLLLLVIIDGGGEIVIFLAGKLMILDYILLKLNPVKCNYFIVIPKKGIFFIVFVPIQKVTAC